MPKELQVGDLVAFRHGDQAVGVVSQPISEQSPGHVLTLEDGYLNGVPASIDDVDPADEQSEGYAQLAFQLIKLGNRVIEQRLIVYRH